MPAALDPAIIDRVAERMRAGDSNGAIGAALNLGRNQIAGIISRLRQRGDPRVPAAGTRGTPVKTVWEERDALADAFADGAADMTEAARVVGLPIELDYRRWAEIRASLGWQAQ